ncbi:maleylpyruvate isomerase family mycothiol-dependent enzyme [Dietzia sp. B32]|uniref:maleylpyruvate isomerase family mycothiol-dependent enzyme n=1 Tax=Dietzia sp. B32 TaxID=2915130 RepID=UPI0021AD9408|nr:maleylpyruvate isomerase family mycothiol-dependent enzyme [Dietzia sp. B32]UVE96360.1 maleylpyruvate isomerase family mycothiol-dependent enzyme [Dietzia sp. B32]
MTTTTGRHSSKRAPRLPRLERDVAERLAATEYDRVAATLDALSPEQWRARTDCTEWDVRAMAGHMLGMIQMLASWPEMLRQQVVSARRAKREGLLAIDALTALQVAENDELSTDDLIRQVRRLAPKAVRHRRRAPGLVRRQVMEDNGEWWSMGYLFDVILTRDPFMHRVDIATATGLPMTATADHEGVIVDDVVAEWAGRHDSPYDLELTGPAGGRWQRGDGAGERIVMDAFEFCRALSGRTSADGLLRTQVPF